MNNITKYLLPLLSICMGACSTDIVENENIFQENNEITKIIAVSPQMEWDKVDSRTVITMGNYPNGEIVWAEKDTIGIYPNSGDQLSFPIVEGVGTSECVFNGGGWALKADSTYTAYSPFNRSYYYKDKKELPISMLGQKQIGNNNSTHLGKYDIQAAQGNKPTNGSLTFALKRKVAFVRFDLTAPKAAEWKSITLESDAHFPVEATMDLSKETPILTNTSSSNSVTLELENVNTNDSLHIVAYMAFLPVDITNKSLSIKLTDNEGNEYSSDASVVNDRTNFEANGIRWITADFIHKKSVIITDAGTLSNHISDKEKYSITQLTIAGPLNSSDIKFIREMIGRDIKGDPTEGKLSNLDIRNCTIVDGGGLYYEDGYSGCGNKYGEINAYMFYQCTNLQKIALPNSVTTISESAFSGCSSLSSVILPENLSYIGSDSFRGCSSLPVISLPNNVTQIESGAFSGCESLFWVEILGNVTCFKSSTFTNCQISDFFCFAITPPTLEYYAFTNSINEDAVLYVPSGYKSEYEESDWKTYFSEIKEM